MRRYLIIFLLVFMPLHLSWAAVATYCQHETGQAAQHFGHHEHKHHVKVDKSDQDQTKSFGVVDVDCGFCHACCVVIVSDIHDVLSSNIVSMPIILHYDGLISNFSSRPERPNWTFSA